MLDGLEGGTAPVAKSLIADLLALPTDRYPALDMSPPQRKAALLSALVDLLTRMAADAPVILLLEDAHWIDPTTTDLWTRLIDSIVADAFAGADHRASRIRLAVDRARPCFVDRAGASDEPEAAQLAAETAAPRVLERRSSTRS